MVIYNIFTLALLWRLNSFKNNFQLKMRPRFLSVKFMQFEKGLSFTEHVNSL